MGEAGVIPFHRNTRGALRGSFSLVLAVLLAPIARLRSFGLCLPLLSSPTPQTAGVDFVAKQVNIMGSNAWVELYLYDCAGQSIFNQLNLNSKHVSDRLICQEKEKVSTGGLPP